MRIAIASTVVASTQVLASWITYHTRIGVEGFYVFVDHANELYAYQQLGLPDSVRLIVHDEELQQRWRQMPGFGYHGPKVENHTMSRQCLNIEVAARLAQQEGFDWLFHIDADELICLDPQLSLSGILAGVDTAVETVRMHNHEAIPEALTMVDYLQEVGLFKRNSLLLSANQWALAVAVFGEHYFRFYGNGKSAVRLSGLLKSLGVHQFAGKSIQLHTNLTVLHFPCCGLNHYARKYDILGDFNDYWMGEVKEGKVFSTHWQSRDLRHNPLHFETYYRQNFMEQGLAARQLLVDEGILFRFDAKQYLY